MIRPILAVSISAMLLFGTFFYVEFANKVRVPAAEIEPEVLSSGEFRATVRRTFDCQGNRDFDVEAMLVRFHGDVIFQRDDRLAANEPVELGPLEKVVTGQNTLFVSATPAEVDDLFTGFDDANPNNTMPARAIRIQVFRDNEPVADRTLWQAPGAQSITGSIVFDAVSTPDDSHTR